MGESVRSGRKGNFFIIENNFIDHYAPNLGCVGAMVYSVLLRYADKKDSTFVGTARVAEILGQTQRTVQRYILRLADLGLIKIQRPKNSRENSIFWIMPIPKISPRQATTPLFDALDIETESDPTNSSRDEVDILPLQHSTMQPHGEIASGKRTEPGSVKENGKASIQESSYRLVQFFGLTKMPNNFKAVEAAIEADVNYSGRSPSEASGHIKNIAIQDRDRGIHIDKFYFEDAKWRRSGQERKHDGPSSKSSERRDRNQQVIVDSLNRRYGGTNAGTSGSGDGVQGAQYGGDRPLVKTPRTLLSGEN